MGDLANEAMMNGYNEKPKHHNNSIWTDCNGVTRQINNMHPVHLWYTIKFVENHEMRKYMIERLRNMKRAFKESGFTERDIMDEKFGLESGLLCMYPKDSIENNVNLCCWCLEVQYEK